MLTNSHTFNSFFHSKRGVMVQIIISTLFNHKTIVERQRAHAHTLPLCTRSPTLLA